MDKIRKICLICKEQFEDLDLCPVDGGRLAPIMQDALIGTVFAEKYEMLSVLGSGGMSIIYKAQHRYMERMVAIKLLHPFLVQDPVMLQRFQYEAKAASNLSHPNIVTVFDFGITDSGRAYLVMDYLEGEDLGEILTRKNFLSEDEFHEILRQTLCGLAHAHSKGVIHRDLKPSNIFLVQHSGGLQVKLVDFGIAKISDPSHKTAAGATSNLNSNLTGSGEVFGSPLYMSPEQCMGRSLDVRSDIYSLGCLMYEVLTGRRPLVGLTAMETMQMHLSKKPEPLSKAAPKLIFSKTIERAVMKCLEKKPDHRFSNVGELYFDLYGEKLPALGEVISDTVRDANEVEAEFSFIPDGATHDHMHHKPPHNAKINRPSPWSLAAAALAAVLLPALYWLLCVWPGPSHDPGTFITRWNYTFWMSRGEECTKLGHYAEAEEALNKAEDEANKFADHYGRLGNVLRAKLTLFSKASDFRKREETIAQLTNLTGKRAQGDLLLANKELDAIEAARLKLDPQSASLVEEKELELRMRSALPAIMDISKRLQASGTTDDQENLLNRTVVLYSHFVGDNDVQMADLVTELANCHIQQDEFVEARPLLVRALTLERNAAKAGKTTELSVAEASMRLGQFDRDRSAFSDAEKELKDALEILRKYDKLDRKSNVSIRGYRLLTECLNGLADYAAQINDNKTAQSYRKQAELLKKQKIDYHPEVKVDADTNDL